MSPNRGCLLSLTVPSWLARGADLQDLAGSRTYVCPADVADSGACLGCGDVSGDIRATNGWVSVVNTKLTRVYMQHFISEPLLFGDVNRGPAFAGVFGSNGIFTMEKRQPEEPV
jgi:hypothetical protein